MLLEILIVGFCIAMGTWAASAWPDSNQPEAIWALRPDILQVVLAGANDDRDEATYRYVILSIDTDRRQRVLPEDFQRAIAEPP
jgi:hypothetical protein